jgi:hypothetical protein
MNLEDHKSALSDALKLRASLLPSLAAHPASQPLVDAHANLLKSLAEACGAFAVRPGMQSQGAAFAAGVQSGDFANVLGDFAKSVTLRRLHATSDHRAICVRRELKNFMAHEFPLADIEIHLKPTAENAEFVELTPIQDGAGVPARIVTYGQNFGVTRQTIKNDDVELIQTTFEAVGAATARLEAALVYGLIESNPTLGDGLLMFHADLGNAQAAALDATSLGAAMGQLRTMPMPGGTLAGLPATVLLVAPELELPARKLVYESGLGLRVIAAAELPTGRWYLFADPALAPVVGRLTLRASGGEPVTIGPLDLGAAYDGLAYGVRVDVGAAPLGRIGAVKGGL